VRAVRRSNQDTKALALHSLDRCGFERETPDHDFDNTRFGGLRGSIPRRRQGNHQGGCKGNCECDGSCVVHLD